MTTAKERSAPASVGEFRDRLVLLYQRSGSPSHSALCKAALAHQAPQLAKATLSDFLRNKYPGRLPRQDFVRALLVGCLGAAGAGPAEISAELERWDGWWGALVVASGSPPTTGAVQIPSAAPEPALRPRPVTADRVGGSRWRTAAVGAGCALAGAGATMGVLALAEPSSDPSLMYGPCAEAIDHSGRVGSVASPGRTLAGRGVGSLAVAWPHGLRPSGAGGTMARKPEPLEEVFPNVVPTVPLEI